MCRTLAGPKALTFSIPKQASMNGEAAQDAAPEAPPWQRAYAALSDATLGDNAVDPAEDSWGSGCCICALITNRARECGLAAFNPSTFKLSLCQYVESSKSHPSITHLLLQAYECVSAVVLGNGAPATRDGAAVVRLARSAAHEEGFHSQRKAPITLGARVRRHARDIRRRGRTHGPNLAIPP